MKTVKQFAMILVAMMTGCASQPTPTSTPSTTTTSTQNDSARIAPIVPSPARSVRTSGTATVYVKPDEVNYRFSINAEDRDLATAKAANDAACKGMLEFVKSLGVNDRDVQTESVRSSRAYEERPDRHREFTGYVVTRDYTVKLRDVSAFDRLSDKLVSNALCTNQTYDFGSSAVRELRDQARRNAIQAAREKALLLAKELNCEVGNPSTISEESFAARDNYLQNSALHDRGGSDDAPAADVTPLGQIAMTATIDVTFDLVPTR